MVQGLRIVQGEKERVRKMKIINKYKDHNGNIIEEYEINDIYERDSIRFDFGINVHGKTFKKCVRSKFVRVGNTEFSQEGL